MAVEVEIDVGLLKSEIKKTYASVSEEPGRDFIFPTGRAWAEDLRYPAELPGVGDAGKRFDRRLGNAGELVWVVEIFGPPAAGREDEVQTWLGRDGGVGLLDLALQERYVDLDVDNHYASSLDIGIVTCLLCARE